MDLLYFVLLISVLIFIHESGHFTFAKLFGVKVLTFSIGFGPKILRIRGKETEYCLGALPFGGFVRMLEEGRGERIAKEDERRTFEAQSLWKRIVIILAGPLMNLVFPVVLYTSVYLEDRDFLPPTIGTVVPGGPADGLLFPGDRVQKVNGLPITVFPELQRFVAKNAGRALRLEVLRDGVPVDVTVTPREEIEIRELDIEDRVGRIGIVPSFAQPIVGVPRPDSPAYRAGLRTFDRIVAVNGRKVDRFVDFVDLLAQNRGDTVVLTFLRPVDVPRALGGLCDLAVMEPGIATLTPAPKPDPNGATETAVSRSRDVLTRTGIESSDLYVAFVPEGSSEWKAGLRGGDRITTLDGAKVLLWQAMETDLVRGANRMRTLTWTRSGEPMAGSFQLRQERWTDEFDQVYQRYVFRTIQWAPPSLETRVPNPARFRYALRRGVEETTEVVRFLSVGIARMVQGKVSLASVSGPITLYDIAGQAGAKGTTYFVWAMAIISINLGLVNLLPIPVLDGGTLAIMLIEAVAQRSLARKTREIASLIGMGLLGLLMLIAFKNDVERHWDVIVSQIREIFGRS